MVQDVNSMGIFSLVVLKDCTLEIIPVTDSNVTGREILSTAPPVHPARHPFCCNGLRNEGGRCKDEAFKDASEPGIGSHRKHRAFFIL